MCKDHPEYEPEKGDPGERCLECLLARVKWLKERLEFVGWGVE